MQSLLRRGKFAQSCVGMGLEVLMALVESELFPNVTDWPLCSSKHAPEKAWVSLGISSVSLASTKVCVPAQARSCKECAPGRMDGASREGREQRECAGSQGVEMFPHGDFEPLRSKISPNHVVSDQAEIVLPPPQCVSHHSARDLCM